MAHSDFWLLVQCVDDFDIVVKKMDNIIAFAGINGRKIDPDIGIGSIGNFLR